MTVVLNLFQLTMNRDTQFEKDLAIYNRIDLTVFQFQPPNHTLIHPNQSSNPKSQQGHPHPTNRLQNLLGKLQNGIKNSQLLMYLLYK